MPKVSSPAQKTPGKLRDKAIIYNQKSDILHSIWAGDAIVDTLEATFTVPATLAPGNYLIRHELIALHQANNPQCTMNLSFSP